MTEEDLNIALLKAQKGDQLAFGLIYDHFSQKLYRFVYFRVGQKEIAEDILADTFVKAWVKIGQINTPKAFSSWLYQVAKNNVIDYYRIKRELVPLDDVVEFLENAVNPVDEVNLNLEQRRILKAMENLPMEQQQVVRYKFFEDLSNEEIAYIMNKSEGAIRVIQHRAIFKLKSLLKP